MDPVWHWGHLVRSCLPLLISGCGLRTVHHDLFILSLGVISRLYSMTVTLPGYLLYHLMRKA